MINLPIFAAIERRQLQCFEAAFSGWLAQYLEMDRDPRHASLRDLRAQYATAAKAVTGGTRPWLNEIGFPITFGAWLEGREGEATTAAYDSLRCLRDAFAQELQGAGLPPDQFDRLVSATFRFVQLARYRRYHVIRGQSVDAELSRITDEMERRLTRMREHIRGVLAELEWLTGLHAGMQFPLQVSELKGLLVEPLLSPLISNADDVLQQYLMGNWKLARSDPKEDLLASVTAAFEVGGERTNALRKTVLAIYRAVPADVRGCLAASEGALDKAMTRRSRRNG